MKIYCNNFITWIVVPHKLPTLEWTNWKLRQRNSIREYGSKMTLSQSYWLGTMYACSILSLSLSQKSQDTQFIKTIWQRRLEIYWWYINLVWERTSKVEKMVGWSCLISKAGITAFVKVWCNRVCPNVFPIIAWRYLPSYLGPATALIIFLAEANSPLQWRNN